MAKKTKFADFAELDTEFVFPGEEVGDVDEHNEDEQQADEQEDSDEEELPVEDESDEEDEQEDDSSESDEDEDEDDDVSFAPFFQGLAQRGVLSVDEDKEYDDSEEGFDEAIKDTVEARFNERLEGLPETAKRIMQLAMSGGSEDDLQDLLTLEDGVDWEDADMDDDDVQKAAVEEAMRLREPDLTDEEVEERLADLEDLGKLRKQAEKDVNYLVKQVDLQKKQVEQRIKLREEENEKAYKTEVKKVEDFIQAQDTIAGLPLTKKEKEGFLAYLTVKDKKGNTESDKRNTFERRIMKEYLNYMDFNVKQVERKVTTEVTKNIKKQLSRYKAKGGQGGNNPIRVERETGELGKLLMPWDIVDE